MAIWTSNDDNTEILPDARRYRNVASAVFDNAWEILPHKLRAIGELVNLVASGERKTEGEIAAIKEAAARRGRPRSIDGGVAVMQLHGVVAQHAGMMTESSGGTSTDEFGRTFDSLMADSSIGAIVLDVDSPGGSVYGVTELSEKIRVARETKPVIAVANSEMASAAYHIGTAASELVVTPSGEVGSIGVVAMHVDESERNQREGENYTLLHAGEHKIDGNPYEPLNDASRAELQGQVDRYYEMFVGDVAKNRGITPAAVKSGYGKGRMVGAQEAVELGMADRIATLENVISGLLARQRKGSSRRTAADMRRDLAIR